MNIMCSMPSRGHRPFGLHAGDQKQSVTVASKHRECEDRTRTRTLKSGTNMYADGEAVPQDDAEAAHPVLIQ